MSEKPKAEPNPKIDKKLEKWLAILELARFAPTPHNTQWYYLHPIDAETAQVCVNATIKLPYTDPNDQFRFVGLGSFVRHLELAASAKGFMLATDFNPEDADRPVMVRITERQIPDTKYVDLIWRRQTSRLAYQEEQMPEEDVRRLTSVMKGGYSVHLSGEPNDIKAVQDLNRSLLLSDLQNKGSNNELNSWVRYSKRKVVKHPTGLTPATLADKRWKVWMVFHFRRFMLTGPMKMWNLRQYNKQSKTSTVGWLYGPLHTHKDQYEAGRFLMDFWMKVTELGYYLHPYGSIMMNQDAHQIFLQDIGITEEHGKVVWLAFRIGHSARPARAPRMATHDYIRL